MPTMKSFQSQGGIDVRFPSSFSSGQQYSTPEERQAQTKQLFNTTYNENRGMNPVEKVAMYAGAIGLDLIDTASSSLPGMNLINPRGQVFDFVGEYGGEMGAQMEGFYTRNQAAVELGSGVIGAVATGYLAGEVILPQITNRLAQSTMITSSALWRSGAGVNAAVRAGLLEANAGAAADGIALRALHPAKWKYVANQVVRSAGKAAFEEAAIAVTMNQNQAIISDDMSENLFYAGLGIIGGGAFGALASRFEMRAIANSPEMTKARVAAIDSQGITALRENQPTESTLKQLGGTMSVAKESANTTALALEYRQVIPADATPAMRSRLEAQQVQSATLMNQSIQRQTTKGISGVTGSAFSVDSSEGKHLQAMLHEKPMAMFGLDSIGSYKMGSTRQIKVPELPQKASVDPIVIQARADFEKFGMSDPKKYVPRVQSYKKAGAQGDDLRYQAEVKRLAQEKKAYNKFQADVKKMTPAAQVGAVRDQRVKSLLASGDPELIREGRRLEKQQALGLVNKTWMPADHPDYYTFSAYEHGRVKLERQSKLVHEYTFLDETGKKVKVGDSFKPDITGAPLNTMLQTNEAMIQVFNNMVRSKQVYGVPVKPTWYQLDSAIEFERRGGKVDWTKSGIKNSEEAIGKSLALKKEATKNVDLGDYWNRLKYNLPLPDPLERIYDAAGDGLRAVLDAAELGASVSELKALRKQMLNSGGFKIKEFDPSLDADMFKFNLDESGKWRDSPIGYFDTDNLTKTFGPNQIAEQLAEIKAERFHTLTANAGPDEFVPQLTASIIQSPDYRVSTQVSQLADDQVTGVGNALSQASGELLSREFRYRDTPTMKALLRTREGVSRATNDFIERLMKQEMGDIQSRLNAAPAAKSTQLLKQFLSNKSGWDVERNAVDLGDGFFGFELSQTISNIKRVGAEFPEGSLLVNPRTGKPIVLDKLGVEYMQRYNRVTDQVLQNTNRIRRSLRLDELKHQNWYTPPPDTRGKHIAFTFDSNRKLVPGGGIVAESSMELERLIAAKNRDLPKGQVILTRTAVDDAGDLYDSAMMDWVNPGATPAPARSSAGTLSSDLINQEAVGDSLTWVKRQAEQIANGTIRVLYDSPLSIVRARGAVEAATRSLDKSPIRTIWDEWEATILGRSFQDMEKSISGRITKPLEQQVDLALETAWPAMRFISPRQFNYWFGDLAQKVGLKPTKARTFDQLVSQLGDYTPYKDAVDYAEQTLQVVRPPEIKEIAQSLNRLSAAVMLRWFEIPHAAMNLIGIMTTMPSIVRSGTAPVTMYLDSAKGKVGVIDTYKILGAAMKDMVHERSKLDWEHMVRNGDTTQQSAEFNIQMASIQNPGTFKRVMLGDPAADPKSGVKGFVKSKGVDGMISLATDMTENLSRTYSHFVGLQLAKYHGITEMGARHSFAREVANAAIANYNPANRPELYQSAFGSMFGLFMSYMQNYNQRLFRWMEKGQYADVGRQLTWQASLFGVASLPGYRQVESLLLASGEGKMEDGSEATMTDHIYAKFGPGVGSMLAHGGLDQLGVVLYTRGDMNYRDVTANPAQLMAGLGVLTSAYSMVSEAGQSIAGMSQGEDIFRLSEVMARNMPNRMMKGAMTTLLNDGKDVDKRGQIVSENRTMFESWVRALGLRSSRQQAEINAFYANNQMQEREAARMDNLRVQTRQLMRQPGWESRLQETFDKYVALGGRPDHYRTWIKDNVRAAQSTRGMNDLRKAMSNPKNQDEVWRYNAYGAN